MVIIEHDLILDKDSVYFGKLVVYGSILCSKNSKASLIMYGNLIVHGDIDVKDLQCCDLVCKKLSCRHLNCRTVKVNKISCKNLDCNNLKVDSILASTINARDIWCKILEANILTCRDIIIEKKATTLKSFDCRVCQYNKSKKTVNCLKGKINSCSFENIPESIELEEEWNDQNLREVLY